MMWRPRERTGLVRWQAAFKMLLTGMVAAVTLSDAWAADDLFGRAGFPALASDVKAAEVGDILTVIVFEAAEASNTARKSSSRRSRYQGGFAYDGELDPSPVREDFELGFGGSYAGTGEVRRRETFVAQLSTTVVGVLQNGNLVIEGEQRLRINGELTKIGVRGVVRPVDINPENQVLSTRIAGAEINYNGQGFVTRSTRPGVVNWLFGVLGLG